MKRVLVLIMLLAFGGSALAQNISGSAHDFSGDAWSGGEICKPCHAPHKNLVGKVSGADAAPMWNHTETNPANITVYGAASAGVAGSTTKTTAVAVVSGVSLLCMSCHDGSVNVDSFGGPTPPAGSTNIDSFDLGGAKSAGYADLGQDLTKEHPIGVVYPATGTSEFVDKSGAVGSEVVTTLPLFGTTGRVECASCHDVHNNDVEALAPALLRVDNGGSDLCLTCHDK